MVSQYGIIPRKVFADDEGIVPMAKHQKTLNLIFTNPVLGNIAWREIEKMLMHYGAEISEGRGSRVRVALNGEKAVFHRPHPEKETDKGAVKSVREFLENAGVTP